MATDPSQVFREATEAINERGMSAFAEFCAPDVVCDMTRSAVPGMGVLRGLEATLEAVTEWADAFEEYSLSYSELVDLGAGRVFAVGEQRGRPRGGAEEVSLRFSQINEILEGKVQRLTFFREVEEGRRAAGLTGDG